MERLVFLLISTRISISSITLYAQNDSIQDLDYYFDDKGRGDRPSDFRLGDQLVKVNLLAIIHGDLPFYYEKIINDFLSLEIGAGLLLPYYIPEVVQIFTLEDEISDLNLGYSFWLFPKYYFSADAPNGWYGGPQIRTRHYKSDNGNFSYFDFTYNVGYLHTFGEIFLIEINAGTGYRFKNNNKLKSYGESDNFVIPFSVKFGIQL